LDTGGESVLGEKWDGLVYGKKEGRGGRGEGGRRGAPETTLGTPAPIKAGGGEKQAVKGVDVKEVMEEKKIAVAKGADTTDYLDDGMWRD
jgi:hypothetical protein